MASTILFRPETMPNEASADFWRDVRVLAAMPDDDLWDAFDDLVDRDDLPTWLLGLIFVALWGSVLQDNPPGLRSLRAPFESLEMRCIDEQSTAVTQACKLSCQYLQEIIDDDLDWTGFTLPGENT